MNQLKSVFPPHESQIPHPPTHSPRRTPIIVGHLCQMPIPRWRFTETPYNCTYLLIMAACLSIFCTIGRAQDGDSVAEREIQRRQSGIPQGEAALARGKTAM